MIDGSFIRSLHPLVHNMFEVGIPCWMMEFVTQWAYEGHTGEDTGRTLAQMLCRHMCGVEFVLAVI